MTAVVDDCLLTAMGALGLSPEALLTPLPGGANNRVFRVDAQGGPYLLKAYFRNPHDPRPRAQTEFLFSQYAWENGVRCIPRPVACDAAAGLGLYEFVDGDRIEAAAVSSWHVQEAVAFLRQLNQAAPSPRRFALPAASEACFSLADHMDLIARRIDRLAAIGGSSDLDAEAARFVRTELTPLAGRLLENARSRISRMPLHAHSAIPERQRILSPSDFGFHNALLAGSRLVFVDFEYAGWDDPAKTICDFFCQVAVPVSPRLMSLFLTRGSGLHLDPEVYERIELLMPLYRLKWCCIILNEFLPAGRLRREYAAGAAGDERKRSQLGLARRLFEALAADEAV